MNGPEFVPTIANFYPKFSVERETLNSNPERTTHLQHIWATLKMHATV